MRFAFMTFSTPQLTLDECLAVAKELGYDGIEPRTASGHHHGIELDAPPGLRRHIREKAAASGVALCCLATSCRYADPETCQDHAEETLAYIDLAADVGSPVIRVFGGALPEGLSRDEAIATVAQGLCRVAEHAAHRGVTVCLETHDDWCDPAHVAAVMERVDHPNIAVNWDIMHPVRRGGATIASAFAALRPWIRHLHVHDGVDQADGGLTLVPIGDGVVDHGAALELLRASGYTGYISGEWINWEPYAQHLPRELATLRRLAKT